MQGNLGSSFGKIVRYSGMVYGIGFILLCVGAIALIGELLGRSGGALFSVPQLVAVFVLFIVALGFGIVFASSVIRSTNLQRSDSAVKKVSLSVTSYSMMILFAAIALI